jgi:hypothetical protein
MSLLVRPMAVEKSLVLTRGEMLTCYELKYESARPSSPRN